jgi:hypothetical protein
MILGREAEEVTANAAERVNKVKLNKHDKLCKVRIIIIETMIAEECCCCDGYIVDAASNISSLR